VDWVTVVTVGLTMGVATTIMHLWLFVDAGFLNYYYVCTATIIAVSYVISAKINYNEKADISTNRQGYVWPVFAYLLLTFGAACSWPLLTPAFLLTAVFVLLPLKPTVITKQWKAFVWVCAPLAAIIVLHLLTIYMQTIYRSGNSDLVLMAGVLGNFNIAFLLIGLAVVGLIMAKHTRDDLPSGIVAVLLPFVFIVIGLMALHYFKLGEAHYYVIKASMILEMLFLVFGVVYVADGARRLGLHGLMRLAGTMGLVLFVVFACIGTLPHPFVEVRSLFRKESGAGIPPFVAEDVRTVNRLQQANKLQNFNMTILHYDPPADRYFAHIQIAAWAQTVSKYGIDTEQTSGSIDVFTDRNQSCFSKQFSILTWPVFTAESKRNLEQIVRTCARTAAKHGQYYYVVTDKQSAPVIEQAFGSSVKVVY
jgi:hypothetical protein